MALKLNDHYLKKFIPSQEYEALQGEISKAHELLCSRTGAGNDFLGWTTLPMDYDKEEFARIKTAAESIRKSCDIFVVIGIGGSYLGARAAIEFLQGPMYNQINGDAPDIYYAGCNISASSMNDLLRICEGKDICINVISKSGTTTEPAIAFRVFRALLEKKYGKEGARERIFVTTDRARGTLKSFSDDEGYQTFVVPDDVGGRYSVLTAVGLLPIAVAGVDVDALMKGAADAKAAYTDDDINKNDCYRYAAIRNILYRKGKVTEIMVGYETYAQMFTEWWKQLYGESEGKNGLGIFPASVIFSTDLHSLGQFIQEGTKNQFETVLFIENSDDHFEIPNDPNNIDGLNFLSGMQLDEVRNKAMLGTLLAHEDGGVPNIVLHLKDRSAYTLGYAIYFFELACAISGYVLGVNPFDQPGVEAYKKNMFALLGKPGYEDQKAALEARL